MYVFCFTHDKLLEGREDPAAWFTTMGFPEVCLCPLAMQTSLASIAREFIEVVEQLHLLPATSAFDCATCYAAVSASAPGPGMLGAFFPFDPYLLKRSSRHVDPLYNSWDGLASASGRAGAGTDGTSCSQSDNEDDQMLASSMDEAMAGVLHSPAALAAFAAKRPAAAATITAAALLHGNHRAPSSLGMTPPAAGAAGAPVGSVGSIGSMGDDEGEDDDDPHPEF
eukprot:TRINITY_DN685_c0_g1_i2.p1 TRINITY_DN685_c0_g1~~TRINITY_DN685_c0_g1_i2.p1  ORF type:complete len:225 (-),score=45.99 TRINITY_DN685_c0_g1_i2:165-839(-)